MQSLLGLSGSGKIQVSFSPAREETGFCNWVGPAVHSTYDT